MHPLEEHGQEDGFFPCVNEVIVVLANETPRLKKEQHVGYNLLH
jgi:hypothetical protein